MVTSACQSAGGQLIVLWGTAAGRQRVRGRPHLEEGVEGGDELHGERLLPAVVAGLDHDGAQRPPGPPPVRAALPHPLRPLLEPGRRSTGEQLTGPKCHCCPLRAFTRTSNINPQ
jgi:hypothetical protein